MSETGVPLPTDQRMLARHVIGAILDGQEPNGTKPSELGPFGDCYTEMVRAWNDGGKEAARQVYTKYAEYDPQINQLRCGDPEPPKDAWTVAELLAAEFPPPRCLVPGLLPEGLVFLAGRPKLGKSWLGLQFATAVGTGGKVLGRDAERGKVLYLALEDNEARIQDRLRKQRAAADSNVVFRFIWASLAKEGTSDLILEIDQQGFSLVVIDTLSRALGRADQMDQADMNVTLGALQRIALDRHVTILLIDHHRKSSGFSEDVIDDLMGATSKAGVADAAMGLYRKRGEKDASLKVTGRDIEELELAVNFDHELSCWQFKGTASEVKADSVQENIVLITLELGGSATATKISRALGRDLANTIRELNELVARGIMSRGDRRGREVPYTVVKTNDNNNKDDNNDKDDKDDKYPYHS